VSQLIDIAIVTIAVLAACAYIGRMIWRKYFRKRAPKQTHKATLTLGGKPIK
jgi:hypothetical protein